MIQSIILCLSLWVLISCSSQVNEGVVDEPLNTKACQGMDCAVCTLPWGGTLPSGQSLDSLYSKEIVSCDDDCEKVRLNITCKEGILVAKEPVSGATVNVPNKFYQKCYKQRCDCELASGDVIAHKATVTAYSTAQAACTTTCAAESASLKCNKKVITGGDAQVYKHLSCTAAKCDSCKMPCGGTTLSGGFRYCYKNYSPASCGLTCETERIKFVCDNGVIKDEEGTIATEALKTQYSKSSCNDVSACSSCQLSDGRSVNDGHKVTFFKSARVACGQQCFGANAVTLTCSNGTFADKAQHADFNQLSCEPGCDNSGSGDADGVGRIEGDGGGAPRQLCQLPWRGGLVTHKTRLTAFSRMSVPKGEKCSAYSALIECDGFRGLWSGGATFIYPTCVEQK